MKKNVNGKMSAMELDIIAGGVGFCYYVKDGDKYNFVLANRALSRNEVIQAWNTNGLGMSVPMKTDANGNVVSQSLVVSCGRGLKTEHVDMLNVAWASLLEDLVGRELTDDEFRELERLLKATCRLSRELPDSDLEED